MDFLTQAWTYFIGMFRFNRIKPTTLGVLGAMVAFSLLLAYVGRKRKLNTKAVVFGGLCIALSFGLSYIRLYKMPQGGSVTAASMLPMFVYSYFFGPAAGIMAGTAYGFLQLIQDFYPVHWAQVLLDYPIAFAGMGLAGLFRKNLSVAVLVGGLARFIPHFISGFIFFADYAPLGQTPIYYSFVYNLSSIGVDTLICFGIVLLPQIKNAVNKVREVTV